MVALLIFLITIGNLALLLFVINEVADEFKTVNEKFMEVYSRLPRRGDDR